MVSSVVGLPSVQTAPSYFPVARIACTALVARASTVYRGTVQIPTLDIISTERNIIGNIVGSYNELAELMALAQAGQVTLHTRAYPLTAAPDALADLDAGRVRGRAILIP